MVERGLTGNYVSGTDINDQGDKIPKEEATRLPTCLQVGQRTTYVMSIPEMAAPAVTMMYTRLVTDRDRRRRNIPLHLCLH